MRVRIHSKVAVAPSSVAAVYDRRGHQHVADRTLSEVAVALRATVPNKIASLGDRRTECDGYQRTQPQGALAS